MVNFVYFLYSVSTLVERPKIGAPSDCDDSLNLGRLNILCLNYFFRCFPYFISYRLNVVGLSLEVTLPLRTVRAVWSRQEQPI